MRNAIHTSGRTLIRTTFITLIIFFNAHVNAQSIEVIGGMNINHFYDLGTSNRHNSTSYTQDYGYTLKLVYNDIRIRKLSWRFSLGFDKYKGHLLSRSGSLGGSNTIKASVEKSILSVGIYPFNFKIANYLKFSLGLEFGRLISESFEGTRRGYHLGNVSGWNYNLNEIIDQFSEKNYLGIRANLAYDFKINDQYIVTPQYSYYLGFNDEFVAVKSKTKSMRQVFSLGIKRKIQ